MARHVPEEDFRNRDMSKPFYDRPTGEFGIYLDPYDAEPQDPKAFGSKLYFINDLTERLYAQFKETGLDTIKGAFEKQGWLNGVYFEGFHKGVILSVSFDSVDGLEELWRLHEQGKLNAVFKDLFVNTQLLKNTKTRMIDLRTRLWKDEYDACKKEINEKRIKPYTLEDKPNDIEMLKQIKDYQQDLASTILTLKDDVNKFDQTLGKFLMVYKQNISGKVQRVTTVAQMNDHLAEFKEKSVDLSAFDHYKTMLDNLREVLVEMETNISYPLAQIHAQCETPAQRKVKQKIKDSNLEWQQQLEPESDLNSLRHPDWKNKILLREQRLFLGLVSLPVYATEAVKDIDLSLDEYLSGILIDLRD